MFNLFKHFTVIKNKCSDEEKRGGNTINKPGTVPKIKK